MIISVKNLPRYFSQITFPVEIFEEKADSVAFRADKDMLVDMMRRGKVYGVGSTNRLKKIRLNPDALVPPQGFDPVPEPESTNKKKRIGLIPRAEDSRTWQEVRFGGGVYYQLHVRHCHAFSPENRKQHV